jgi:hypothetical protein
MRSRINAPGQPSPKENSMRLLSANFLPFALGLAGFLVGALTGFIGNNGICCLVQGYLAKAVAEYSALYGLLGSFVGLTIGSWAGFSRGKRVGQGEEPDRKAV